MSSQNAAATFDPLRPRLIRIAYRMLGSVADAEDMVQEAFLRWLDADRDAVREPEAYLRPVVTRLCRDPPRQHAGVAIAPRRGCDRLFRWRRQEGGLTATDCRVR